MAARDYPEKMLSILWFLDVRRLQTEVYFSMQFSLKLLNHVNPIYSVTGKQGKVLKEI